MKFLKNTLAIAALFAVGSVAARGGVATSSGSSSSAVSAPVPTSQSVQTRRRGQQAPVLEEQQIVTTGKSYKDLRDQIMATPQRQVSQIIDSGTKTFSLAFLQKMASQAKDAGLTSNQFTYLMQTARDQFAPFTGDNTKDAVLLQDMAKQISTMALKL